MNLGVPVHGAEAQTFRWWSSPRLVGYTELAISDRLFKKKNWMKLIDTRMAFWFLIAVPFIS